jgi:hypothetical protein
MTVLELLLPDLFVISSNSSDWMGTSCVFFSFCTGGKLSKRFGGGSTGSWLVGGNCEGGGGGMLSDGDDDVDDDDDGGGGGGLDGGNCCCVALDSDDSTGSCVRADTGSCDANECIEPGGDVEGG